MRTWQQILAAAMLMALLPTAWLLNHYATALRAPSSPRVSGPSPPPDTFQAPDTPATFGAPATSGARATPGAPATSDASTVHAWLLNGDAAKHHTENIQNATETLLRLGVQPDRIFISSAGRSPSRQIPRRNFGLANRQNLILQRALLSGRTGTLIIYITGHGSKSTDSRTTNSCAILHRSYVLRAEAFLSMVQEKLSFDRLILVIDTCFGGGFVKTFYRIDATYCGASPVDENHPTFCRPFAPLFWDHVAGFDTQAIRTCFNTTLDGCDTYKRHGTCPHAPYGCPTYRSRGIFRQKVAGVGS